MIEYNNKNLGLKEEEKGSKKTRSAYSLSFSDVVVHNIDLAQKKLKNRSSTMMKSIRRELTDKIKICYKNKKYIKLIRYLGELSSIEDFLGDAKKSNELKDEQTEVEVLILKEERNNLLKEIKAAENEGNFEKVENLYRECRNIANKLFMFGLNEEAEKSKLYAYNEAVARSKAITNKKISENHP